MPQAGKYSSRRQDLALLGALCFFLSAMEYMIPKPLPFIRLGLANLPLMLAVDLFPLKSFCVLVLLKICGQALISGTLFSYIFIFSLAGTSLSAAAMFLLRRGLGKRRISFAGIGTAGALVSNMAQIMLARLLVFGESARYIAPPMLALGLITGALLGVFCEQFSIRSLWYKERVIR